MNREFAFAAIFAVVVGVGCDRYRHCVRATHGRAFTPRKPDAGTRPKLCPGRSAMAALVNPAFENWFAGSLLEKSRGAGASLTVAAVAQSQAFGGNEGGG